MAHEDTVRPVFVFLEKAEIGYVHCPPNCSYSVVRREIEVDELDALKGKDFCFLGLRRIPISRRQEERHFCRENTVEVAFASDPVVKQPVLEQDKEQQPVFESDDQCDIELLHGFSEPDFKRSRSEPLPIVHSEESSRSTTETDGVGEGSQQVIRMRLKLARPAQVARYKQRLDHVRRKLVAINRNDEFELTSCDEDGKAKFKIYCHECKSEYGTGSEDMWYNFFSSHCKTKAHLDRYFARTKNMHDAGHNSDILGPDERKKQILESNKKQVEELLEGELAKWSMENGTSLSLYTPSVGDYSDLKRILVTCDMCSKGLRLFPPSGDIIVSLAEHIISQAHVKKYEEDRKKLGRPTKFSTMEAGQQSLLTFLPRVSGSGDGISRAGPSGAESSAAGEKAKGKRVARYG